MVLSEKSRVGLFIEGAEIRRRSDELMTVRNANLETVKNDELRRSLNKGMTIEETVWLLQGICPP